MDWSAGAAALLYGAASNLDTLILALSWGGRGGRLSPGQWGVIAGVTTGVTWCALSLGGAAAALTAAGRMLGAVVLVGLGLWTLLDWLRRLDQPEAAPPPPSGLRGCLPLAAALLGRPPSPGATPSPSPPGCCWTIPCPSARRTGRRRGSF